MQDFYKAFVSALTQALGHAQVGQLPSFGVGLPKGRTQASPETKVIAQAKAEATRKARGTMVQQEKAPAEMELMAIPFRSHFGGSSISGFSNCGRTPDQLVTSGGASGVWVLRTSYGQVSYDVDEVHATVWILGVAGP